MIVIVQATKTKKYQIGEIIHVEAKIGTVVGDGVLNNILKVLRGGGGAKGGGVSKGPFFNFSLITQKPLLLSKKCLYTKLIYIKFSTIKILYTFLIGSKLKEIWRG